MSENNSIIARTVLTVTSAFLKQESKINEKLDDILYKKLIKLDSDKEKYNEVLKFNILFYKILIRNTEPLIGKWIEKQEIPDIDSLESELEIITNTCRDYINNIREQGIEKLKDYDLNSYNAYDKIKGDEKRKRLEKDYKVLNLYKDLLNITLRKISLDREFNDDLYTKKPVDIKRNLKREIIAAVNKILSNPQEIIAMSASLNERTDEIRQRRSIENAKLKNKEIKTKKVKVQLENGEIEEIEETVEDISKVEDVSKSEDNKILHNEYKNQEVATEEIDSEDTQSKEVAMGEEIDSEDTQSKEVDMGEEIDSEDTQSKEVAMGEEIDSEDIQSKEVAMGEEIDSEAIQPKEVATAEEKDISEEQEVQRIKKLEIREIISKVEVRQETREESDLESYMKIRTEPIEKEVDKESVIDKEYSDKEDKANEGIGTEISEDKKEDKKEDKVEEESKESETIKHYLDDSSTKISKLESALIEAIEFLDYEKLFEIIENEFVKICSLEELPYCDALGFGKGAIVEFASIVNLIPLVGRKEKDLLEGAMRLVVIGEFGEQNFKEYIKYVSTEIVGIRANVLEFVIESIRNKYPQLKNHDLALKKSAKSQDIDVEEYAYMIENADKDQCFRNKTSNRYYDEIGIDEYDCEDESSYDKSETGEEDIQKRKTNRSKSRTSRRKKRYSRKLMVGTIAFVIILGAFGAGYTVISNKDKKEQQNKNQALLAETKNKSEDDSNKEAAKQEEKKTEKEAKEEQLQAKITEMESLADGKGVYYRVYAGSHKLKKTAEETLQEYNAKGIEGSIVEANNHFRIKIGDFSDYGEAKQVCSDLAKKSIDTFIQEGDRYFDLKTEIFAEKALDMSKEERETEYQNLREELKQNSKNKECVENLDTVYQNIAENN